MSLLGFLFVVCHTSSRFLVHTKSKENNPMTGSTRTSEKFGLAGQPSTGPLLCRIGYLFRCYGHLNNVITHARWHGDRFLDSLVFLKFDCYLIFAGQ